MLQYRDKRRGRMTGDEEGKLNPMGSRMELVGGVPEIGGGGLNRGIVR